MISQKMGRVLSAIGAVLLVVGLFLTWYHIDRTQGSTDTTGWQTFTNLRIVILVGAVLLFVSALIEQTRAVLIARSILGVVLGALILRRIIDPPDVSAPISAQFGVVVGLIGAIAAVLGGLVDSSREVADRYPDLAFWRPPAGELGPRGSSEPAALHRTTPPRGGSERATVDSTAEEI
jgi:peptidoglycan/LPS O-acetylase OafA/YrhL